MPYTSLSRTTSKTGQKFWKFFRMPVPRHAPTLIFPAFSTPGRVRRPDVPLTPNRPPHRRRNHPATARELGGEGGSRGGPSGRPRGRRAPARPLFAPATGRAQKTLAAREHARAGSGGIRQPAVAPRLSPSPFSPRGSRGCGRGAGSIRGGHRARPSCRGTCALCRRGGLGRLHTPATSRTAPDGCATPHSAAGSR